MERAGILAYITGTVDRELLLWYEYLLAENRLPKAQLSARLTLSDAARATVGEIGHRLGRKALSAVATAATPDTIVAWYRKLVARKFDGSRARRAPGRPPIDRDLEDLIVRMARQNRACGYDRIVGALANLGYAVSGQRVGSALRRHGIPRAPDRKHRTTWAQFIQVHLAVLTGTDLLYGGGPQVARSGDLLRAVLHPSPEPQSCDCRHHRSSERAGINLRMPPE